MTNSNTPEEGFMTASEISRIQYIRQCYAEQDKGGYKHDEGKPRFDLLPYDALTELVNTYTYGAKKYSDDNYLKGMAWGRVFAAMMRHAWAFWRGENKDPESGLDHMAHVAWCAFTLMVYAKRNIGTDNRVILTNLNSQPISGKTPVTFVETPEETYYDSKYQP